MKQAGCRYFENSQLIWKERKVGKGNVKNRNGSGVWQRGKMLLGLSASQFWSASPAVVALLLIVASCCCTPLEVVGGGEVPEFQVLLHDPDEVAGIWLWLISVPALWGVVSGWKTSVCVVSLSLFHLVLWQCLMLHLSLYILTVILALSGNHLV